MNVMTHPNGYRIGAATVTTDGEPGTVCALVIDPDTRKVTHLAVEHGHRHHRAKLVPTEIATAEPGGDVQIACDQDGFVHLDDLEQLEIIDAGPYAPFGLRGSTGRTVTTGSARSVVGLHQSRCGGIGRRTGSALHHGIPFGPTITTVGYLRPDCPRRPRHGDPGRPRPPLVAPDHRRPCRCRHAARRRRAHHRRQLGSGQANDMTVSTSATGRRRGEEADPGDAAMHTSDVAVASRPVRHPADLVRVAAGGAVLCAGAVVARQGRPSNLETRRVPLGEPPARALTVFASSCDAGRFACRCPRRRSGGIDRPQACVWPAIWHCRAPSRGWRPGRSR